MPVSVSMNMSDKLLYVAAVLQILSVRADIVCACTVADSNTQKCSVPRALVAAAAVTLSVNMICTQTDSL